MCTTCCLTPTPQPPINLTPMQRPAAFFDRDNTLIISDGYLGDPDGVVLVKGAADVVAALRDMGYAVVVTNRDGCYVIEVHGA